MNSKDSAQTAANYLSEGLVARADALASVRECVDFSATGHGTRVIDVKLANGLSFEVLPDSGLDIGALWYRGSPMSWRSPLISASDPRPGSDSFLSRFQGGMMVTCGFENIGPATDRYEMHGSHHRSRAADVGWTRDVVDGRLVVAVSGTVGSMDLFGRRITVERRIIAGTDKPSLEVTDTIHNEGYEPHPIALLYHVNFGAPFIEPGTVISMRAEGTVAREECVLVPNPQLMPTPTTEMVEAVFEHRSPESIDGWACALIRSPSTGAHARVRWQTHSLPRVYQWVWPTRRGWALGIEPANAPLFGAERENPFAGAPLLAAGESVTTGLSLDFIPPRYDEGGHDQSDARPARRSHDPRG